MERVRGRSVTFSLYDNSHVTLQFSPHLQPVYVLGCELVSTTRTQGKRCRPTYRACRDSLWHSTCIKRQLNITCMCSTVSRLTGGCLSAAEARCTGEPVTA